MKMTTSCCGTPSVFLKAKWWSSWQRHQGGRERRKEWMQSQRDPISKIMNRWWQYTRSLYWRTGLAKVYILLLWTNPMKKQQYIDSAVVCVAKGWYILFLCAIDLHCCPETSEHGHCSLFWLIKYVSICGWNALCTPVWVTLAYEYTAQL